MFHRSCVAFIFALLTTLIAASAQQPPPNHPSPATPAIPDTPAGYAFKAWLDSFNSGDRAAIDAYIHKYEPDKSIDREMQFRSMARRGPLSRTPWSLLPSPRIWRALTDVWDSTRSANLAKGMPT